MYKQTASDIALFNALFAALKEAFTNGPMPKTVSVDGAVAEAARVPAPGVFNPPAQQPLPHPPVNGAWPQLTKDQLVDNLVVNYQNNRVWGKEPTGGFPGMWTDGTISNATKYQETGYAEASLMIEIRKLDPNATEQALIESRGIPYAKSPNQRK